MANKVKVNIFDGRREALTDTITYGHRDNVDLRVTKMPSAPKPMKPGEIREVRMRLHASQAVFARFLCVSPKAVQSWEQGIRRPQSSALRLLHIAKRHPRLLLEARG